VVRSKKKELSRLNGLSKLSEVKVEVEDRQKDSSSWA